MSWYANGTGLFITNLLHSCLNLFDVNNCNYIDCLADRKLMKFNPKTRPISVGLLHNAISKFFDIVHIIGFNYSLPS